MIVLLGVLVVILGFVTRRNPVLVVGVAGIVTGLLGRMNPLEVLAAFGRSFADSRSVTVFAIVLPVIGLLERYGLREQARTLIGRLGKLSAGRFLAVYLLIRQVTAAFGLNSIGGPAQTVRPLVAPMAEAAAERTTGGPLPDRLREKVRSFAASSDTVGLFFGEDCFIAIGSILLITGFVNSTYHQQLEPTQLALWAIPLAVCALVVHGARLLLLDRKLEREMALHAAENELPPPPRAAASRTGNGSEEAGK
ncbi:DUF969 domain-containing protein [Streptomyces antnestii]|uniref:DUF969 domain-containing protein n=1 Tax=Streptomyces antnestii TaxID=2494256 RepID=A0A437PK26_9ACTN|nr:DUF969 domain-containing protein [Streptomyces sp. San01]RVU22642.1 DUF969 domain-containing protein [Streptomyces sp. San01]